MHLLLYHVGGCKNNWFEERKAVTFAAAGIVLQCVFGD